MCHVLLYKVLSTPPELMDGMKETRRVKSLQL